MAIIAPGLADVDEYDTYDLSYDYDTNTTVSKRDVAKLLAKRKIHFSLKNIFKSVASKVESGIKSVALKVAHAVEHAAVAAYNVAKTVVKDVIDHVFVRSPPSHTLFHY